MSFEGDLSKLIAPFVGNRVYQDTAPENGVTYPLATYQQVGGRALWYSDKKMPDKKHARIQVNVWAKSRIEANQIARQIENALCTSSMIAEAYGAFTGDFNDALHIYGTRQDFGIWYQD